MIQVRAGIILVEIEIFSVLKMSATPFKKKCKIIGVFIIALIATHDIFLFAWKIYLRRHFCRDVKCE